MIDHFLPPNVQVSRQNLSESDPDSRQFSQKTPVHSRLQYTHTDLNENDDID